MSSSSDADGATGILTVDLDAIAANYRLLAERTTPAECAAVVKADAYGLGADRVGPALARAGCRRFFVATLDEAVALRQALAEAEIGVLSGPTAGTEPRFKAAGLVPVLNEPGQLERWAHYCADAGRLPAYVHLDTGMNRLGLAPAETDALAADPATLAAFELAGWMSHLAISERPDHPLNAEQRARFADALRRLPPAPATLANSSGIFLGADFHMDMVRPGVALYGVNPTPGRSNPMRPVVRLQGLILQVRDVDSPMTVGYGASHRVAKRGKIATISIGYADGYLRSLSSRGTCLVAGREVPVVGRVSMDLTTVDVSATPDGAVKPGDWADLIGPGLDVDAVARAAGTIGYEILTALGARYHRVYRESA